MMTAQPICYTSADSVFQIAAHEETFGLDRLYEVCAIARRLVDSLNIGRVIARPFVGSLTGGFKRTANRRDYSVPPPEDTVLDLAEGDGRQVISIGKIADIFAHRGTGLNLKADGNNALFDRTLEGWDQLQNGGLLFANFIDFDSVYGHRRDIAGYAAALEAFDLRVPELLSRLKREDLLVHHRRSRLRSDLAGNRPYARTNSGPARLRNRDAGARQASGAFPISLRPSRVIYSCRRHGTASPFECGGFTWVIHSG